MDRRRIAAATLSAVLPGLGQAVNRRRRLTFLFLIPSLLILAILLLLAQLQSPVRIAAWVVTPSVLGTVLTLNLVLVVWRLVASLFTRGQPIRRLQHKIYAGLRLSVMAANGGSDFSGQCLKPRNRQMIVVSVGTLIHPAHIVQERG